MVPRADPFVLSLDYYKNLINAGLSVEDIYLFIEQLNSS